MPEKPHLYIVAEAADSSLTPDTLNTMPNQLVPTHIGKLSLVGEVINTVPGMDGTDPPRLYNPHVIATVDTRRSLREEFFASDPHDSKRKPH